MAAGAIKRYTARGIVLGKVKYGDKGVVVQMLTSTHGRQSYIVQGLGTGRGKGKLALFQPMFALEYEGLLSPKMQLHRFGEVHNGLVLQTIPFDVKKSTIALFMAEVLHRLVKESEPNEMLFDFVWGSVEALDDMQEGVANFHLWFLANLSRFLGFSPAGEYSAGAMFDMKEGRFTTMPSGHSAVMDAPNAEILRDLLECDVRYLAEIGLNRRQRVEFLDEMMRYYGYHLEAVNTVRSIRILQEVF